MKDRILQIMKKEGMTQQEFASALEISPASLSSIFNGRTNPTNNHVQAVHRCFPKISISWLMFGEGDMYEEGQPEAQAASSSSSLSDGVLFDMDEMKSPSLQNTGRDMEHKDSQDTRFSSYIDERTAQETMRQSMPFVRETIKYIDKPQRKVTEVRIFFDDGTYETFSSGK